ncbi:hypothetical protein [Alcanivorax sp. DP30]|uniref:hypothetical protein n=1 Tax=Alcanivorax sp. DP30 TaxID=2606217 RepID=UPI0013C931DB|nr:hypothetical protein [Alcanivorax sp. DP30]MZR64131.1 hypothetical protein [Alcanivorax sp. DP30]
MSLRQWVGLMWLLPTVAVACLDDNQNEQLLYASAFRLAEAGSCSRMEAPQKAACLDEVLAGPATRQEDLERLLSLIRYGNVRRVRVCNRRELVEIRRQGGERAELWACHDIRVPDNAEGAGVRVLAVGVSRVEPTATRIRQFVALRLPSHASRTPLSQQVD